MSAIFPIAPLEGLTPAAFISISVVLGAAFGFFLERAGFGSAKNLTSIFVLRDFRVFRVMFSAVITAMLGSQLLRALGLLNMSLVGFDPTYFWAMLAGGLLFGVGFYVGGFCPGTAVVAAVRGRLDAPFFLLGIVLGIYGFALLYDAIGTEPWFASFYAPADAARRTIYGDGPAWPWIVGLVAVALVAFKVVPLVERRFALRTVEQLAAARAGKPVPETIPPRIGGSLLKVGPPLAGAAALAVVALDLVGLAPSAETPRPTAVAVDDEEAETVDPLTLAGWVVAEAHRRAAEEPAAAYVVDLRRGGASGVSIPGALQVELGPAEEGDSLRRLMDRLGEEAPRATRGAPVVLVDEDGEGLSGLAVALRRRGVNALVLEGGFAAWQSRVLESDHPWPAPTLRLALAPPPAEPPSAEGTEDEEGSDEPAEGSVPPTSSEGAGEEAHGATAPPAPEALPEVDLAALQSELRAWLAGRGEGLPPRLPLPGTVPPRTKAATVRARGGAGGGCG